MTAARAQGEDASAFQAEDVLAFWFGARPNEQGYGRTRDAWFESDPAFDAEVREHLGRAFEAAAQGALGEWAAAPRGALALVILLDQVPRNIFRNDVRAFATDPQGRAVAEDAITRGFDRALLPVERMFLYLPFQHSERLADQERSVTLCASLECFPETANALDFARRHYAIVARFGRFPHRNRALGRATTPEEAAFLAGPNSFF